MGTSEDDTIAEKWGDDETWARYRRLFVSYWMILAVILIVVILTGVWVSYGAYIDPGETIEERTVEDWTTSGELSHSATVTEPNSVFEEGTTLENEPLYYIRLSPAVNGNYGFTYAATDGDVTVELTVERVIRATGDGTTYWQESEVLGRETVPDMGPNEEATVEFGFEIDMIDDRINEIEEDLGASPGETEIVLVVTAELHGDVDGVQRTVRESHDITVAFDGGTYQFEDVNFQENHIATDRETVAASPSLTELVGGPLLALIGLGGLSAVVYATRRVDGPTAAERKWLDYLDDRDEFGELVTEVRLPTSVWEGERIDVDSLGALSQLAIDIKAAIVHDLVTETYMVVDDELRYVFEPPERPWPDCDDRTDESNHATANNETASTTGINQ